MIPLEQQPTPASRNCYILLALLFGRLGVHNFYAGRKLAGFFQAALMVGFSLFDIFLCLPVLSGWLILDVLLVKCDGKKTPFVQHHSGWLALPAVLGLLSLCWITGFPELTRANREAQQVLCSRKIKLWHTFFLFYEEDHGMLPSAPDQDGLLGVTHDPNLPYCPAGGEYHYLGSGLKLQDLAIPAMIPLVIELNSSHGCVCFADGSVLTRTDLQPENLTEQLKQLMLQRHPDTSIFHTPSIDWHASPYREILENATRLQPPVNWEKRHFAR